MEKAIFLDRDGVINENKEGYVRSVKEFVFLPNTIQALKLLSTLGYKLIVITNQGGIGRGLYTEKDLQSVNKKMINDLEKNDVKLDKIYYCPHSPEENCDCRKPNQLLFKKANKDFCIDVKKSFMIGDKTADIEWGRRCGCKTILVKTGRGGADKKFEVTPDFIVEDLFEAANLIKANTCELP
ncbi:D-glycero-beta-D-manno-heptose 1,7-bisphosphate 7-phosphatase [Candidatus Woesearchaeota archaeon]|nr:D-glycero-beta-D-manno-heptose 1,7-bisphosphate 7-phosphatase [Candidatus Woesearchaeota archaeon]